MGIAPWALVSLSSQLISIVTKQLVRSYVFSLNLSGRFMVEIMSPVFSKLNDFSFASDLQVLCFKSYSFAHYLYALPSSASYLSPDNDYNFEKLSKL